MNIENIKGVGPKTVKLLNKINVFNLSDLLTYYPYRYQIYNIININNAMEDIEVVVTGKINSNITLNYIKKNLNKIAFKALVNDILINVTIFNRAFLKPLLTLNKDINLIGKYNSKNNSFIASNITFDKIDKLKIEPVYHLISGLHNKQLINIIDNALTSNYSLTDYIPYYLNKKYNFITKEVALKYIHTSNNFEEIKKAKLKLIYEELFQFMFKINYLKYRNNLNGTAIVREFDPKKINEFINNLPFNLTNDQLKTVEEIINDFKSHKRMNRLLLGDVGSGKTIIAVIALYINYLSGYQGVLMAPTEILASQHYKSVTKLLPDLNIFLLTGSTSKKDKTKILEDLNCNKTDIILGTHSLLNEEVVFNNLGLVVTDEQHRFGVNQRNNLQNKGHMPDVIYLSATPIPRTYALTLYGDMDISLIKEKPQGRKDILTLLKKEADIKDILGLMLKEIKENHQIYVVAPLIEENEESNLNDILKLKEKFNIAFNSKVPIEILHGKIKSKEKERIMQDFKQNKIKVLISTTVIEVGIDVSNATMMVIFNAERFGLATLHQLRGRIGRSELESKCILISNYDNQRLNTLVESNDGFYISEQDFIQRGEGDLFGIKQSGDMTFKIASLQRDYKILVQTKEDSNEFIKENIQDNFSRYQEYKEIIKSIDFNN